MTKIIVVRHGWRIDFDDRNWKKTAARPHDPPLSESGMRQARETGSYLAKYDIEAIFASPFTRALQTATAIGERLELPIYVEGGLAEWLNPKWYSFDDWFRDPILLAREFPRIDLTHESLVMPRYPEHTEAICHARNAYLIQHVANAHIKDVVLVSHGSCVNGLVKALTGTTTGVNNKTCAIHVLEKRLSRWELIEATDEHLSASEKAVRYN